MVLVQSLVIVPCSCSFAPRHSCSYTSSTGLLTTSAHLSQTSSRAALSSLTILRLQPTSKPPAAPRLPAKLLVHYAVIFTSPELLQQTHSWILSQENKPFNLTNHSPAFPSGFQDLDLSHLASRDQNIFCTFFQLRYLAEDIKSWRDDLVANRD